MTIIRALRVDCCQNRFTAHGTQKITRTFEKIANVTTAITPVPKMSPLFEQVHKLLSNSVDLTAHRYTHSWSLQSFSQDYNLTSPATISYMNGGTSSLKSTSNDRFLAILFTLRVFGEYLLRATCRKKFFLYFFSFEISNPAVYTVTSRSPPTTSLQLIMAYFAFEFSASFTYKVQIMQPIRSQLTILKRPNYVPWIWWWTNWNFLQHWSLYLTQCLCHIN